MRMFNPTASGPSLTGSHTHKEHNVQVLAANENIEALKYGRKSPSDLISLRPLEPGETPESEKAEEESSDSDSLIDIPQVGLFLSSNKIHLHKSIQKQPPVTDFKHFKINPKTVEHRYALPACNIQIIDEMGIRQPADIPRSDRIFLRLLYFKDKVTEHLAIEASVRDKLSLGPENIDPPHFGFLEFYNDHHNIKDFRWGEVGELVRRPNWPPEKYIDISFEYSGSIVPTGIFKRHPSWEDMTWPTFEVMQNIANRSKSQGSQTISLRLFIQTYSEYEDMHESDYRDGDPEDCEDIEPPSFENFRSFVDEFVEGTDPMLSPYINIHNGQCERIRSRDEVFGFLFGDGSVYRPADMRPVAAFRNITHLQVALGYGAYLDWDYNRNAYEELAQHSTCQLSFVIVSDDITIARVKLPFGFSQERLVLNDDRVFRIIYKARRSGINAEVEVHGIYFEDFFGVSRKDEITFFVTNKKADEFKGSAAVYPNKYARDSFRDVRLVAMIEDLHITRELAALGRFQSRPFFHPLFLNQDACISDKVCPFSQDSKFLKGLITAACDRAKFKQEQKRAISGLLELQAGGMVLSGPPGTGKTAVAAEIIDLVTQIPGWCALAVAPSNSAVDKLYGDTKTVQERRGTKLESECIVRLPNGPTMSRYAQSRNAGSPKKHRATTSPMTSSEFRDLNQRFQATTARRAIELKIAQNEAIQAKSRVFEIPLDSVTHMVLRNIQNVDLKIYAPFPGRHDGPSFDMNAELRRIQHRLMKVAFADLSSEDQEMFNSALEVCSQRVVEDHKALICTPMMATSAVSKNFARGAKGIVLVVDEAAMVSLPSIIMVLTLPEFADKIKAIVLVGDLKQLRSQVRSKGQEANEFAEQLSSSLMEMLAKNQFPDYKLTIQRRMHPDIATFPSACFYDGILRTAQSVTNRPAIPELERELLRFADPANKIRHSSESIVHCFGIEIEGSKCMKSPRSKSRFNVPSAITVTRLVMGVIRNVPKEVFNWSKDMLIQTPYSEQKRAIQRSLTQDRLDHNIGLPDNSKLSPEDMPKVVCVDSLQGNEAPFIITDLTISDGEAFGDFGFLIDEHRACTMMTRAKDYQVYISSPGITRGKLLTRWRRTSYHSWTGESSKRPDPGFVQLIHYLHRHERMFSMKYDGPTAIDF